MSEPEEPQETRVPAAGPSQSQDKSLIGKLFSDNERLLQGFFRRRIRSKGDRKSVV